MRPFVATAFSLLKTAATGRMHRFSYDRRGWWTNRQDDAVFFTPTIFTGSLAGLTAHVDDFWGYQSRPEPGHRIIDVGAGIGDHVLVFSRRVGPAGKVIAIEAHPWTAECLRMTVEQNHLTNTRVIQEAAWDREGTLMMSDERIHERNSVLASSRQIAIRARPLDSMLAEFALDRVDLVKMNIEGAELAALAGMKELLTRSRAIVISCHDFLATSPDDPRRTKSAVIEILRDTGFVVTTRPDAKYRFLLDFVYGRRPS